MKVDQMNAQTLIQEAVTEALQTYIPLKTVQTNKQKPTFATKETRDIIDARDQAYKKYKITQNPEDKRNYSNLRNLVTKNLNQDKQDKDISDMEKALNDRDQWSKAKLNLGWTKN